MDKLSSAQINEPIYADDGSMKSVWASWFSRLVTIVDSGLSTTQTFKDGDGVTKTMTIELGKITKIE